MGEKTPSACEHWNKRGGEAVSDPLTDVGRQTLLPWSGSAIGTRDLAFLTGRGEAIVVGILGAHNAGKTTLLAAWYQHIGRTGELNDRLFAGSFSLEGWEAVGHALRWDSSGPKFPPHTPSGAGRVPGLLHLAMRNPEGESLDYLFTDAPGEWFQRWSVERDAADAEGARWVSDRAATLIIVADCEALAGATRGSARLSLQQLIRRTAEHRRDRPVALVWTKADVDIPTDMHKTILDAAHLVMPDIKEFFVSVHDFEQEGQKIAAVDTLAAVLDWALRPLPRGFELSITEPADDDPFFAYGSVA